MQFQKKKPNNYKKSCILTEEHDNWLKKYKKLLNTAISSWSGFVYQGKVAIYHVLKELDNNGYTLQLDSLDDFAIINDQERIISLHQVKAKKSVNFSSYKEAFEQLKDGGEIINCVNLYFHLAQNIADKTVLAIETEFTPIQIYTYDSVAFCEVNQIDTKIEDLIIALQPLGRSSREYASKVRKYLDNLITEKIFEIHRIIHLNLLGEEDAAYKQRIPFQDFIDILSCDLNQVELGEKYYLYQIKNDICKYYQEYCIENELEEATVKRLNTFISFFRDLTEEDLIKFIRNIMPHRKFNFNSLSDYKDNSPQKTEIQNIFIYILLQIEKEPKYIKNCLLKWEKGKNTFSPTCISDRDYIGVEKICKGIIDNALRTDLDILFESETLLTRGVSIESITSSHVVRNSFEPNNIMQWDDVSLKDIDSIKGDINA